MKNNLSKIAILLISFNLVSCSTNTQSQNTGLGAVGGAVVGGAAGALVGGGAAVAVGAVAGALVGGLIGNSMDSTDHPHVYEAMNNAPNHSTHWVNTKTGVAYTVTPTSPRMSYQGNNNCRQYTAVSYVHGKKHHSHGIACMMPDGKWKTVK